MKEFYFLSSDGKTDIHCQMWVPEEPKTILQIIHGMNEYIDRYHGFAEWLCDRGILVVGDDHIGHGLSVKSKSEYGYFGHKDGWKYMIHDEHKLRMKVQEEYPDLPYIMLGHSFGSFLMRGYLGKEDVTGLSGSIVMGTAGTNPSLGAGLALTQFLRSLEGERTRSRLITMLAFGSYNKRIKNPCNTYAWLTRDEEICLAAPKDEKYHHLFTLAGYEDMFRVLDYVNSSKWYEEVPKDLPILICSGWEDPVGNYGVGPAEVTEKLQDSGHNVNMVLYEEMRHEILNEIGKEAVWEDMLGYILDMADGVCDAERGFDCQFE